MKFLFLLFCVLCFGCDKPSSDPATDIRIKELEAEIKRLKSGNKNLDAAKSAMRQLKKIQSVVEMGVSYSDYTKTLLETKPVFDESIAEIQEEQLSVALGITMKAYVDAGTFWNLCITKKAELFDFKLFSPEERERFKIYNIPWDSGAYARDKDVQHIWATATLDLELSEERLKQQRQEK